MNQETLQSLLDDCDAFQKQGQWDSAIEALRDLDSGSSHIPLYADALQMRAEISFALGKMKETEDDLIRLEALETLTMEQKGLLARSYTRLGFKYESAGDSDKVILCWKKAMVLLEEQVPPCVEEMTKLSNNLGFAMKAIGQLNLAEDYFLKALEMAHNEYGQIHEQSAAISSNLGGIYFAGGFFAQAKKMHDVALDTRREIFGESHPDTAQSYNNMGLVHFYSGEWELARHHFAKAFDVYENLGMSYSDDLETVASNFCAFYRHLNEDDAALALETRVKALVPAVG